MPSFFDSQCSYRLLYCFDLPRQQWSLLNRFRTEQGQGPLTAVPAEGNGNLQTLIYVLVARPSRCLTLSNPVPWQNWMAAYLGYTLRMKTLFRGWPVMAHETHTRRIRRLYKSRGQEDMSSFLSSHLLCRSNSAENTQTFYRLIFLLFVARCHAL